MKLACMKEQRLSHDRKRTLHGEFMETASGAPNTEGIACSLLACMGLALAGILALPPCITAREVAILPGDGVKMKSCA